MTTNGGVVDKSSQHIDGGGRGSLGNLSRAWYSTRMTNSVINPKYPNIRIKLVGEDGNAFSILGRVQEAMRQNNIEDQWEEFLREATSGNYDNLVLTVITWFAHDQDSEDEDEDELDTCDDCGDDLYDCECEYY